MDETEGQQQAADVNGSAGGPARPRRADTETLTYLRSLEPLIDQSVQALDEGQRQQGRGHGGGEDEQGAAEEAEEDRALLVSNLIDELTYKVGSLAMDRHAAPVLEKLARLCTRKQLARLLKGCQGYAHCLASNRYSSHVLQTFFSLAGPMVQAELEGVVEDEDDEEEQGEEGKDGEEEAGPVLLRTAAAALAQELQASWLDLLYDISGTHTLRALFCLLTGMPAIAERRGRNAKHRHAIETAVVLDAPGPGSSGGSGGDSSPHAARLPMHAVPDEFTMLLESLVVELSQLDLMTLHQSLCDPHAGPALCLLVQAGARSEGGDSLCLQDNGPFMQGLVKRALCWAKSARCAEVVYAMAGEVLGSRFLEAALWHSKPESLADPLFEIALRGRLVEFAEHEVANFVVQTWLQRTQSSTNLKAALEELAPAMGELVRRRRAGVLWRLAGAAARLGKHEVRVVKAIIAALAPEDKAAGSVVRALLSHQEGDGSSGDGNYKQQWSLRVREEDGRLQLNVPGARLLECLMRLPSAELARPFCEAIVALPTQSLLVLAKDNVGSRTLLDPVLLFAAAHQEGKGLGDALMGKLKGHYANLAAHPVAFHVLTRCFSSCLTLLVRNAVAEELLAAESRLAGAHFGRRALGVVAVSLYRSNRGKWEEAMAKGERKRQVLEELFGMLEEKKEKGEKGKDKAAAGVQEERGQAKKGKGKGKEKKEDALLALLMGKSEDGGGAVASAAAAAAPSVAAAREGTEGANLDFVLDGLKKGGGKKGKKPKGKEGKGEVGDGSEEDSTAKPAKRKGPSKSKEERWRDRATVRGGGGGPSLPQQQPPREGETPVEKATRLLGKRALMSRTELLSAVGELEREVKKKGKR